MRAVKCYYGKSSCQCKNKVRLSPNVMHKQMQFSPGKPLTLQNFAYKAINVPMNFPPEDPLIGRNSFPWLSSSLFLRTANPQPVHHAAELWQ